MSLFGSTGGTGAFGATQNFSISQPNVNQPSSSGTGLFGGFGASNTTATSTAAGTGLFGAGTNAPSFGATAPSFGSTPSFGQPASAAPSFGQTSAFGQPAQQQTSTPAFNLFTSTATSTTPSLFGQPSQSTFSGLGQTTNQGFGMFGQQQQQQQRPPFGIGMSFQGTQQQQVQQPQFVQQQLQIQMQQQQQQPPKPINIAEPKIFNDERDRVLGLLNRVQAYWGIGKAFIGPYNPQIDLDTKQEWYRFKSVGFAEKMGKDKSPDDEYRFGILIKTTLTPAQLSPQCLQYENNFKQHLGQQFNVKIEGHKHLPDSKVFFTISVMDTTTNRKVPACDIVRHLNTPHIKQQLQNTFQTGNTPVEIIPLHPPTKKELEEYLATPPAGIDAKLWEQAKAENPDPSVFIPVPMIGFGALNERLKLEKMEAEQQKEKLQACSDLVREMEIKIQTVASKYDDCKRQKILLNNRLLKLMIWQEVMRKRGLPLQTDDDELRGKLEGILSELNAPTKFKGCLNELMSRLRQLQNQFMGAPSVALDRATVSEIKEHLKQEQKGINHLIDIVKEDAKSLKQVSEASKEPSKS